MEMNIIKIGNSRGIRLPAAILKQCGIDSKVNVEIEDNSIIIRPIEAPRRGWPEKLELMHAEGHDHPIVSEEIDDDVLEDWNESKY
jgi:antitoxin MazE